MVLTPLHSFLRDVEGREGAGEEGKKGEVLTTPLISFPQPISTPRGAWRCLPRHLFLSLNLYLLHVAHGGAYHATYFFPSTYIYSTWRMDELQARSLPCICGSGRRARQRGRAW